MKFVALTFILFIFGDVCLARNKLEDAFRDLTPLALDSEMTLEIVQGLTQQFVPLALENVKNRFNDEFNDERFPVIPELPELIPLPDGDYTFNITDTLVGDLSVRNQGIHGLSTLQDSLELKLACEPFFGLGVIFGMDLSSLLFQGEYETDLMFGIDRMTGNGAFRLGVENMTASLDMVIGVQPGGNSNKFQLHSLSIDLFITKLILFAENFEIAGFPIGEGDWDAVSTNILKIIMDSWPQLQGPISALIKDVINDVIKDCTLVDYLNFIIGGVDLSCLRVPTIPGVVSNPTNPIDKTYTEFLPRLIAKAEETGFGQEFFKSAVIYALDKIQMTNIVEMSLGSPGQGRVSILPPFDDPLELVDDAYPFNLLNILQGNVSLWDGVITGLSSIDDDLMTDLAWVPFGIRVNFTLAKLGRVISARFSGNQSSEFEILIPPIEPIRVFTTNGEAMAEITNAGFKIGLILSLQLARPTHIQISHLSLDLGYEGMELFVENVFLGDCLWLPTWWEGITNFIRRIFEILWENNPNQDFVLTFLTNSVNNVIKDCTIAQLLAILTGGGDTSCLGSPFQPTPSTPPKPTEPPVETTVAITEPSVPIESTQSTVGNTWPSVPVETTREPGSTRQPAESTPADNAGNQILHSFTFELLAICVFAIFCYN